MVADEEFLDRLDPASSVIAVIDVQNDFCHPDGTMGMAGVDLEGVGRALPRIFRLVDAGRKVGVKVVFVRTEHNDDVDSENWRRRFSGASDRAGPTPVNCATGAWGADFFEVQPEADDLVHTKHRYSAFSSPQFKIKLRDIGCRSILFTGFGTQVCVEGTLRDAVDNDFLITLVTDCCGSYDAAEHEAAVLRVRQNYGLTLPSDLIVQVWGESAWL